MIALRPAETDADLEAFRQVRLAVLPHERAPTVEELRDLETPERLLLLAEIDGEVCGAGLADRSETAGDAFVAPRVLLSARRRRVGTALLAALSEHVLRLGFPYARSLVEDPGSLAFAERFGFVEVNRQVEQVLAVDGAVAAAAPDGVEIVSVADRLELWRAAYDPLGLEAFADMALDRPLDIPLAVWEREWIGPPEAMFVALAAGEVIGCAGLLPDADRPDRAENALTAVRRDWRGRGVASALKRTTLVWAAANGIREVYTWTQRGNADMRRLNEHLGYVTRSECITVRAPLPVPPA
jgi:mycothiol synthase